MTDYVVPSGVRIADADRGPPRRASRRGHDGHARGLRATSTPARSAPRWSRAGSAPASSSATARTSAAAASIMGTLSGGGTAVISIGERCLLGANAGARHLARRRLRRRGRPLRHGRHARDAARRRGRQGARAVAAPTGCCSAATRRPAPSRRCRAAAPGAASTPPCTPTTRPSSRAAALARSARASAPARAAGSPRRRRRRTSPARPRSAALEQRAASGLRALAGVEPEEERRVAAGVAAGPAACSAGSSTSRLAR